MNSGRQDHYRRHRRLRFPTINNYWDIGVRGDTGPTDHSSTVTLNPVYSLITAGYTGTAANHNATRNPTVVSQYCNGSRTPPEYAARYLAGAAGYLGCHRAESALQPAAQLPQWTKATTGSTSVGDRWRCLIPSTGATLGNYAPGGGSPAINYIPSTANGATGAYTLAPSADFFGNARKTNNAVDAGAVEFQAPAGVNVLPTTLTFPNTSVGTTSAALALTLYNDTATPLTAINVAVTAPVLAGNSRARRCWHLPGNLGRGRNCTINIVFNAPAATGSSTGSATLTASVAVNGSPVTLTGTAVPATHLASVSPSPLTFGTWAIGTTSNAQTLTVTNTGNTALAGGTFTFGGGTPQPFTRPAGTAGGTCGATLAVGASCTINVVFAPTTATTFSRTLAVAYTGATVTPTPVTLTGTGVTTRATVSISPNPLNITLASGTGSGTGVVTLNNASAPGGASFSVSGVSVTGGILINYFFNAVAGADTCTGATLAPGASCTVTVRFTNVASPRGVNRTGTITFTDNATGSPQSGGLVGLATP